LRPLYVRIWQRERSTYKAMRRSSICEHGEQKRIT
jgi:hypothetical protein